MAHWVFELEAGGYVGTRKNNGQLYESRPTAAEALASARVFNTKGAATNAGRALGKAGQAREVILTIAPEQPFTPSPATMASETNKDRTAVEDGR